MDREKITHTVQVHERDDVEIEFMVTEQWYIEILDHKDEYLQAGEDMDWFPEKMHTRYKNWIEGLKWDWCISRQRDSGIPFPVWYCDDCGEEIIAAKEDLPVDPIEDNPPTSKCPECGHEELVPEEDVFDTWATSSLTPLINAQWTWDEEDEEYTMGRPELYKFDLRPEGHDIISFWLFHTVVKCMAHTGEVPFEATMNHGHVLDENREKMSKSRGNVVTPEEILQEFPVDAARYWAAGSSVGDDFPFKEKELVSGEKLMRKLWNASKLVEEIADSEESISLDEEEFEEIDKWMMAELDQLIEETYEHMENYEFAKARDKIRHKFWHVYCDNYLEIAKQKLDDEDSESTKYVLQHVHKAFLKLFAPFLSHITEELYNDMYSTQSIHTTDWPETSDVEADLEAGENALEVITALRKYKTKNQLSPTSAIDHVQVYGDIEGFEQDIKQVMHVNDLENLSEKPSTEQTIVEIKLDYSKAGPRYGDKVGEIEEALENGEWMIDGARLEVANEKLKSEEFEVIEEHRYTGEGEMLETKNMFVIIK